MPSNLHVVAVRLDEEEHARLLRLMERMRRSLGLKVSASDAVRAGLLELEKRWADEADPPPDESPPRRKGRPPSSTDDTPPAGAKRKRGGT